LPIWGRKKAEVYKFFSHKTLGAASASQPIGRVLRIVAIVLPPDLGRRKRPAQRAQSLGLAGEDDSHLSPLTSDL